MMSMTCTAVVTSARHFPSSELSTDGGSPDGIERLIGCTFRREPDFAFRIFSRITPWPDPFLGLEVFRHESVLKMNFPLNLILSERPVAALSVVGVRVPPCHQPLACFGLVDAGDVHFSVLMSIGQSALNVWWQIVRNLHSSLTTHFFSTRDQST